MRKRRTRSFSSARRRRTSIPFALVALGLFPAAAPAALPYHELDPAPKLLALTPGLTGTEFAELVSRIERAGIVVPVAVAGEGFFALDAPGVEPTLGAESAVTAVSRAPVAARSPGNGLLAWWNDGFVRPEPVSAELEELHRELHVCAGARGGAEGVRAGPGIDARCGY
jgi:hypothetical protein